MWLPCRWFVNEATVEVEEGREISKPIDGRDGFSSKVGAVLKAGRSNACRIEGRRKVSLAWGRGRTDVASVAEAVVEQSEKRYDVSRWYSGGRMKLYGAMDRRVNTSERRQAKNE